MLAFAPFLAMISFFLIYFHIYKSRRDKHKDYEIITNYDSEDTTIYEPYVAYEIEDYKEEYKKTYYYRYLRKHTVGLQNFISRYVSLKYLQILDDLLDQSGRKYNMKSVEFIASIFIVFGVTITVLKLFFLPINYCVLMGFIATFMFPINDVIISPRKRRKKLIELELPNTLDFFYILMKAGNSFDESLKEIAYGNEHPLAKEFRVIIDEIENKKIPEIQAYLRSSKRVDLDSYTNFIKAAQANKDLGAEIISHIKSKSEDLKKEYMNNKEKQIEKLESKVVIPIVLCFMPPVVFAFFGPQLYDMLKAFIH
jgi:Flp pilus assembly protein TadB